MVLTAGVAFCSGLRLRVTRKAGVAAGVAAGLATAILSGVSEGSTAPLTGVGVMAVGAAVAGLVLLIGVPTMGGTGRGGGGVDMPCCAACWALALRA